MAHAFEIAQDIEVDAILEHGAGDIVAAIGPRSLVVAGTVKPGALMPAMKLSRDDVDKLTSYLVTLR